MFKLKKKILAKFFSPVLCLFFYNMAYARTSLGIGVDEQPMPSHGFFSSFFIKLHFWQLHFEKLMSDNLLLFKSNPYAALWLIGLSFLYGILHSIGPGHGKMVISSYLLADNTTLKRGLFIAFCASMLQALTAILIISSVFLFLPVSWTKLAFWVTNCSFILLISLGIYMLYRTTKRALLIFLKDKQQKINTHTTAPQDSCHCGHKHIVPAQNIPDSFNWKTALSAIFAIGLRPCSGALLIMSFAILNDMYLPGILSIFAMGIGTFITISFFAFIAVHAKKLANAYLQKGSKMTLLIEWLLAFCIVIIGVSLVISTFF